MKTSRIVSGLALSLAAGLLVAGTCVARADGPTTPTTPTTPTAPTAPTTGGPDAAAIRVKEPAPETKAIGLSVGDKAPALAVETFIKGAPITVYEPGQVYVVEFWATWCGPCIRVFPHLSELQKKYEGKARFVGVNIWERPYDANTLSKVIQFVEKQGDKMAYTVAFDGEAKKVDTAFMQAAGQNGIPAAFIVDQTGTVAWIGHPGGMDEPLAKVVAKEWDLKKAAADFAAEREKDTAAQAKMEARQKTLGPLSKKVSEAVAAKDWDGAVTAMNAVKAAFPDMAGRIEISKFNLLLRQANQPDKAYAMKDALLASPELATTPAALNQIAYTVLEGPGVSRRDYPFALAFAEKADEAAKGQDWSIADTLARAQFATGDKAKAVESQTRAIALAQASKIGGDELAELETMLKVFNGEQKPAEETK